MAAAFATAARTGLELLTPGKASNSLWDGDDEVE